jgi:hypothetical protein
MAIANMDFRVEFLKVIAKPLGLMLACALALGGVVGLIYFLSVGRVLALLGGLECPGCRQLIHM